jgi:predicted AAA+ superfamily ATPase
LQAPFPDAQVIDLWYWCDPGLMRALKRSSGTLIPEEIGPLFEGLMAQLLRAYKDYRRIFDEMYYWAPAAGIETEVDFLLLRNQEFVAVEAKSGRTFSEKWYKGLRAIAELEGLQRKVVVYPHGPVLRTGDGIDVMPFDYFANLLAKNRLRP